MFWHNQFEQIAKHSLYKEIGCLFPLPRDNIRKKNLWWNESFRNYEGFTKENVQGNYIYGNMSARMVVSRRDSLCLFYVLVEKPCLLVQPLGARQGGLGKNTLKVLVEGSSKVRFDSLRASRCGNSGGLSRSPLDGRNRAIQIENR